MQQRRRFEVDGRPRPSLRLAPDAQHVWVLPGASSVRVRSRREGGPWEVYEVDAPDPVPLDAATEDLGVAVTASALGRKLRGDPALAAFSWDELRALARRTLLRDHPDHARLLDLIVQAGRLAAGLPPCHQLAVIQGGVKSIVLVDEHGFPCW